MSAYRIVDSASKQEVIKEDLDFLGIPVEYQSALLKAIFTPRWEILESAPISVVDDGLRRQF